MCILRQFCFVLMFRLSILICIDLEFNDKVRVLCVYNGPEMVSHEKWDVSGMLAAKARLSGN